jgi:predicted nucleic acid binding AN1-type Zn finger protein
VSLRTFWQRLLSSLGLGSILCDTCKYDYGTACTRSERPNATVCDGYKKKRS